MVDDFRPKKGADKEAEKNPARDSNEPVFEPPEVVAEREMSSPDQSKGLKKHTERLTDHAKRGRHWFKQLKGWQKFLVVGLVLIILTCLGLWLYAITRPEAPYIADPTKAPEPTTVASPLTGVQVEPELAKRPVIGVMIENSPDARPQSGLYRAGVVFEAVAEGGITRFLALYQEDHPKYVGPVRSARPYYVRWVAGYDAPYAHVGGSPAAIGEIKNLNIKDMDQFYNADSYERVNSRFAPHNVYTSLEKLFKLAESKNWKSSDFTGFERKREAPSETPKASTISVAISSQLYNVSYSYDKKTNSYKRKMAGAPHKDERAGQQISPKVVVIMVTTQGINADGVHTTYKTNGSGTVYVFQDGSVIKGTWEKKSNKGALSFKNTDGSPLKLNPGQTWISVVGSKGAVSYKP